MDSKNYKTFNFPSGSKNRFLPPSSKTTQDNGYLILSKDQWKRYQESANNQKCLFCELEKDILALQGLLGNHTRKSSLGLNLYHQSLRYGKTHLLYGIKKEYESYEEKCKKHLMTYFYEKPFVDRKTYEYLHYTLQRADFNIMVNTILKPTKVKKCQ